MPAPKFLPWAITALALAYAATLQLTHSRCTCNAADATTTQELVSTIRDTP